MDVYIYEDTFRCEDCENEVGTHNPYHFPHTDYSVSFNRPEPEFDRETFVSHELIETWKINELREMFESPPEMGDCGVYDLSWTQLAIARCNELSR